MIVTCNLTHTQLQNEQTEGRRLHFYDRGEEIPLVEQGVWQVYRGVAQLSQLSVNGEEILLGWAQPSTFFGMWLTHIESYQVKALSELYLKWYPLSEIEASPHLSHLMLTQVVRRMRQTEALLAIAGLRRVEERLQELLQLLKKELGQPVPEGTRLAVRLTHQNLANAIGTTRVTITRLLGDFQRQGIISLDSDRHMIVHH
ncbi:MAG: Crp/Fnr family transcriptional regulator [Hydrococcus sp. C42_A2020_068]|uniref:Crp/Fnr family transcriptional regulator n=1 Tax=Pleurocapsa sp. PCC 7327 TaxID=118163 RepID=UPI00029FA8DE|nr:Crp/Fnr family transcriptional regulator [Pleurocapsa sp. PCC 7327]AFY78567.1 cAMP-binding protein [Pleurocapsa sp. PCC 7327]MBF2020279.1 Crp/Fnr family transcriptional regulator [Hydrococcus sp. C42_A2020_068]